MIIHASKELKQVNKDLVVYKKIKLVTYDPEKEYLAVESTYFPFLYEVGKIYTTHIEEETNVTFQSPFDEIERDAYAYTKDRVKYISKGFHSATSSSRLENAWLWDCKVLQFIIPKGAWYMINNTGLVVSNQIMLRLTEFNKIELTE
jgi:hypothetical protein